MFTSLAATRADVAAVQCRNHLKQLTVAWALYSEDNRGRLVFNSDGSQVGSAPGNAAWVAWSTDFTFSAYTNIAMLIDHKQYPYGAYLGPYVRAAQLFKCPADRAPLRIAGIQTSRVRSVSMNNFLGQNSRTWTVPSKFLVCSNAPQIRFPKGMFVLLDESEVSINDGWFGSDPDNPWQLIDYPAAYHNGGAGFSFADGHCEALPWQDRRTIPLPGELIPVNAKLTNDPDLVWLQQRAAGVAVFP